MFYWNAYYKVLGLDFLTLDLPAYYISIGSLAPILNLVEPCFIVLLLYFLARCTQGLEPAFWQRLTQWLEKEFPIKWRWLRDILSGFAIFFFLLASIPGATRQGRKAGEQWRDYPTPKIHLTFRKDEAQLFDPEIIKANENRTLFLLVQTKDLIVCVIKNHSGYIDPGVYIVSRANLLAVHTINGV